MQPYKETFLNNPYSLKNMKIIIVGGGTTGNIAALLFSKEYEVTLIDRDIIEEKNIGRQVLFTKEDIGKPKALVLEKKLKIKGLSLDLNYENIQLLNSDLVIDCTDNLETRFLINEYCKKNSIPWIYTGVIRNLGRVMPIKNDYCFNCIFQDVKGLETCETIGVDLDVVFVTIGLAFKIAKEMLEGKQENYLYVVQDGNIEKIKVNKKNDCKVCNGTYEYLNGKKLDVLKFCGSGTFQFRTSIDYDSIVKRLNVKDLGGYCIYKNITIFKDRVLIKTENEKEARKIFNEVIGN